MMKIVSNTGPIIGLGKIGLLLILNQLASGVLNPPMGALHRSRPRDFGRHDGIVPDRRPGVPDKRFLEFAPDPSDEGCRTP
jgi:hypothetical protein